MYHVVRNIRVNKVKHPLIVLYFYDLLMIFTRSETNRLILIFVKKYSKKQS